MILGVDPRVEFIPSCPDLTGQTGGAHRSDRCRVFVGIRSGERLVQWRLLCFSQGQFLVGFVRFDLGLPRFVKLLVFVTSLIWSGFCSRA